MAKKDKDAETPAAATVRARVRAGNSIVLGAERKVARAGEWVNVTPADLKALAHALESETEVADAESKTKATVEQAQADNALFGQFRQQSAEQARHARKARGLQDQREAEAKAREALDAGLPPTPPGPFDKGPGFKK